MGDGSDLRRRLALLAHVPAHVRRLTWSPERLAAERARRLQALIDVAQRGSPFHRERLGHVDASSFREADLCSLPVMTKADVMSRWDDVVTDPELTLARAREHVDARSGDLLLGRYRAYATGGTSGRSGLFVYDDQAWNTALLGHVRMNLRARLRHVRTLGSPVVATIVAEGQDHLSAAVSRSFESHLVRQHRFAVTHPLPDLVEQLNAIRPTTLISYGSFLSELVAQAERGRLRIRPTFVMSTSDPLLPSTREAIERLWTPLVSNVWATTELGPAAIGCFEAPGMHLAEDLVIFEAVDRDNHTVTPGRPAAKVLVTNLFNHAMPLIRYELSDEVVLLPGPCPCGSTHRRIADIAGRTDDAFRWGDLRVDPHLFRSPLSHQTAVTGYQIRQTPRGVDVLLQVDGRIDPGELERYWCRRLSEQGLVDPEVRVRVVDDLERSGVGKLRYFVPLAS